MRGDRHVERQLPRTSSPRFESDAYYDGPEWDDARHGQPYANHHRSTTHHQHNHSNTSGRVGRLVSDQVPSRTTRGNPRSQFSRTRREDDQDTDDGSSSVVSYSSAGGYVPQSTKKIQNNNRTNYHEPTVRVHYVSQEETNPRFYSQHNNHLSHSDYLSSASRMPDIPERFRDEKDESEMYVTDSTFRKQRRPGPPGSIYSHYSAGNKSRAPSELSSVKTKTSRQGGVVVETMAAPNPFCPNTKGVCCLMVLVNLGLILVTLGFSIVLQLYDPPFVWYCGIAFLIVGFIGLIASLVFCVYLCRESREIRRSQGRGPGELYWTHHWQKRIPIPGMGGRVEREKDDLSTVYSARTDYDDRNHPDKFYVASEKDPRRTPQPIHSYRN